MAHELVVVEGIEPNLITVLQTAAWPFSFTTVIGTPPQNRTALHGLKDHYITHNVCRAWLGTSLENRTLLRGLRDHYIATIFTRQKLVGALWNRTESRSLKGYYATIYTILPKLVPVEGIEPTERMNATVLQTAETHHLFSTGLISFGCFEPH
jgi:hypothetical protein